MDVSTHELDELLAITRDGKSWIAKTEAREKKKTRLSSLKIKYNKVFGYFIEVSKAQADKVPDHYIRKQTLVNAERFITQEMKEVETTIFNAQDRRNTELGPLVLVWLLGALALVLAVIVSFITATAGSYIILWLGVTLGSLGGAVAISLLELFVAFLQAYIFTFLAALFIGMAIHQH